MPLFQHTFLKPARYRVGPNEYRDITASDLREYVTNTRSMLQQGLHVPVLSEHALPGSDEGGPVPGERVGQFENAVVSEQFDDAIRNVGWVQDVRFDEDSGGAVAVLDITNPQYAKAIEERSILFTSPELREDYTDGLGRRFGRTFAHFALTPKPRNPAQTQLSAVKGGDGAQLAMQFSLADAVAPLQFQAVAAPGEEDDDDEWMQLREMLISGGKDEESVDEMIEFLKRARPQNVSLNGDGQFDETWDNDEDDDSDADDSNRLGDYQTDHEVSDLVDDYDEAGGEEVEEEEEEHSEKVEYSESGNQRPSVKLEVQMSEAVAALRRSPPHLRGALLQGIATQFSDDYQIRTGSPSSTEGLIRSLLETKFVDAPDEDKEIAYNLFLPNKAGDDTEFVGGDIEAISHPGLKSALRRVLAGMPRQFSDSDRSKRRRMADDFTAAGKAALKGGRKTAEAESAARGHGMKRPVTEPDEEEDDKPKKPKKPAKSKLPKRPNFAPKTNRGTTGKDITDDPGYRKKRERPAASHRPRQFSGDEDVRQVLARLRRGNQFEPKQFSNYGYLEEQANAPPLSGHYGETNTYGHGNAGEMTDYGQEPIDGNPDVDAIPEESLRLKHEAIIQLLDRVGISLPENTDLGGMDEAATNGLLAALKTYVKAEQKHEEEARMGAEEESLLKEEVPMTAQMAETNRLSRKLAATQKRLNDTTRAGLLDKIRRAPIPPSLKKRFVELAGATQFSDDGAPRPQLTISQVVNMLSGALPDIVQFHDKAAQLAEQEHPRGKKWSRQGFSDSEMSVQEAVQYADDFERRNPGLCTPKANGRH